MTEPNLETRVKEYESLASAKAYLVDTSARILFYMPPIALYEKYVAGLDDEQVLKTRASAVAINLIFGRLHGKVREYVGRIIHTDENSSKTRKFMADTLSGFIIGGTISSAVLYIADVTLEQGLVVTPFAVGYTTFTGRPFGKFLDWYRNKWGITPVYEKKE